MLTERIEKLFLSTAEPALERVKADRETAPPRLRPLLEHIEKHVFDADFSVVAMKQACGIGDNSIGSVFKAHFGEGPREYVEDCRLVVASEALVSTPLAPWQIAELLGYSSISTFSTAFSRWAGVNATQFRNSARKTRAAAVQPLHEEMHGSYLRQVRDGTLSPSEARALLNRLEELYPSSPEEPVQPVRVVIDVGRMEKVVAQCIWEAIAQEPRSVQRVTVRGFPMLALFDELLERCREVGRSDRQRGVEVAKLALEVLRGCEATHGKPLPGRKALGWARVGNAHRLALELSEAESAFLRAHAALGHLETSAPLIEAEVWHLKAALRLVQRRFTEALELEKRAIAEFRSYGAERALLVRGWLQQANILAYSGQPRKAIEDLRRALQLLEGEQEPYLLLTAYGSLAAAYAMVGEPALGSAYLPQARTLCHLLGHRLAWYQLQWTEGHFQSQGGNLREAEELWLAARDGFSTLGQSDCAAVLLLDLAVIYLRQGRMSDALALAAEALPVFEALQLEAETARMVHLLREAWEAGEVTVTLLRRTRSHMALLQGMPANA